MHIKIISLFYSKDKNLIIKKLENYKTSNNKRIASIYANIGNDYIELIQNYFNIITIINKFRLQFADKR